MKTPLEALDEAISRLTALREIVSDPCAVSASITGAWDGMASEPMFHFHRKPVLSTCIGDARELARSLGGNWTRGDNGAWESKLCGITVFLHNAEPARNPRAEAVEL